MTTTTERGPMEQWLDDHNYDKVYLGSDENLYDFAREQDARLAACVEAIERVLVVGSARTGVLMCENFSTMHEYVEQIMGGSAWTHMMGDEKYAAEIRAAAADDFVTALQALFAALRRARGETP